MLLFADGFVHVACGTFPDDSGSQALWEMCQKLDQINNKPGVLKKNDFALRCQNNWRVYNAV